MLVLVIGKFISEPQRLESQHSHDNF